MSDLPPVVYRGAYIPFPIPVPALTDDPLTGQDFSLCWSDAWNPAILGALKVLCRPETWTGSEADIQTAMLGAQELLASITDHCGSAAGIPFACPGDMSGSPAPYGSVSLGFVGTYVAGDGYRPTIGSQAGFTYYGAWINIDFGRVLHIDSVAVEFDLLIGTRLPTCTGAAMVIGDIDHAQYFITDGCSQSSGTGLIQVKGPFASDFQHMRVSLYSDYYPDGAVPLPTGNMAITRVDIAGIVPPGTSSPCA